VAKVTVGAFSYISISFSIIPLLFLELLAMHFSIIIGREAQYIRQILCKFWLKVKYHPNGG
jgi:hypothetical protein